jgi:sortase A
VATAVIRRNLALSLLLMGFVGGLSAGHGAWLYAKAELAQYLLNRAWHRTQAGELQVRPWPWADTWPVARLRLPQHGVNLVVLFGDSGRTLAFGPGQAVNSATPGESGTTLISAHRDTHFRVLKDLRLGDEVIVDTPQRTWHYRVAGSEIIDVRHERLVSSPWRHTLVLLTCYPFNALAPGGSKRYVVSAELAGTQTQRGRAIGPS